MAGRRSRHPGRGMTPLFDVAAFDPPDDRRAIAVKPSDRKANRTGKMAATAAPTPVEYWVRGVFRLGDREQTRTVQGVAMHRHFDADVAKFVRYLTDEGFQFAEGRGYLAELLGVGADDGVHIALGAGRD